MAERSAEFPGDDEPRPNVTDPRTGREFVSPYRYQRQFEAEFEAASNRMIGEHGATTERFAWAYVTIFGGLVCIANSRIYDLIAMVVMLVVPDLTIAVWLTRLIMGALFILFVVMMIWALRGRTRFRLRLVEQRLCFDCGYALIGQPIDENGHGRCPECGSSFDVRRYLRPPRRYHRVPIKSQSR
jgi:hypothetical protein